jgi:ABC-2 type transport system ATP-binding protein
MRADAFDSRAPSQLESAGPGEQPALLVEGVAKRFGRKAVLRGVDLSVCPGEVVGLVGENGCGKTTLLRICAGLAAPDRGTVRITGRLGYCPQQPGLFDRLTADEHLAYFGAGCGLTRAESVAEGRRILASFGFPARERAVAGQLSGGTRQKLNLALALLGRPTVLLLDEPYQGFDHGVYVNFWDHVDSWRRAGQAILVVTHMLAEQDRVDRVVDLSADSGGGSA